MRLIHGQESVTSGAPTQLTSEPLRAVKLWIKRPSASTAAIYLSGSAATDSGVEIGETMAEFDFTASGAGTIDASSLHLNASSGAHPITWTLMVA